MDFELARRNMVDNQVRTNRVTDPLVISALRAVPREVFVPAPQKGVAYLDDDLSVGSGRFLMEPMILARLLQLAEVQTHDAVLDVGCATGYSTAVLGKMARITSYNVCYTKLLRFPRSIFRNRASRS